MHAYCDYLRLHVTALLLTTAFACGTHYDVLVDAGTAGSGGSGGTAGTTGGTAGGGGTAGTGGSGTGGSAGGISSDSGTCGCVGGHVGWGWDGGLGIYHETSALEVCNLFLHQRIPVAPSPPALSCEQVLGDCAGAIGAGDVTRSIAHADVRVASAVIEVGQACRTAGCKPIPAGVDALAKQLVALTKQELAREPCSRTFPPPN